MTITADRTATAQQTGRISYHRLTPAARAAIQRYGLTVAEYVRKVGGWLDGDWHGDRCGCTDDRCVGYHHDEHQDCGCLPALIERQLGWSSPPFHLATPGRPALPNGGCYGILLSGPGVGCRQCGWQPGAEDDR